MSRKLTAGQKKRKKSAHIDSNICQSNAAQFSDWFLFKANNIEIILILSGIAEGEALFFVISIISFYWKMMCLLFDEESADIDVLCGKIALQ